MARLSRFWDSQGHNAPLAEELAQETFFRAMRSLNKFDGRCRVEVWLCQIAKNAYYSYCRKYKDNENILPEMDSGMRVEDAILDREQAEVIYKRLHELNEPYKEVFMLRIFGELEYVQIAELFGKTEAWARVIYHRAKRKLTESIKEEASKWSMNAKWFRIFCRCITMECAVKKARRWSKSI